MSETITNILVELLMSVTYIMVSVFVIPAFAAWLKSKTENEKLHMIIDDISNAAQTSVEMLEQTMVNQLKADGKWNSETQKQVLEAAVSEVVSSITSTTHNALLEEDINARAIITRYIESYIQSKKQVQSNEG